MNEDAPGRRARTARVLRQSRERHRRNPIADVRLTNPQTDYLDLEAARVLWRAGNQIGKSFALALLIVKFCLGLLPWQRHRPPVKVLVISYSWEQMDPLCEKLWKLLPKDQIDPRMRYEPGNGFRGQKVPVIRFIAGPGKGSEIHFATYKQGTKRIAGPSVHLVVLDEPPPENVYGEVVPRLKHHKGYLRIGFTPTPDSPPLDYLRKRVEVWRKAGEPTEGCAGGIIEHQTTLTVDSCTPQGMLVARPWMSEAEIEAYAADLLEEERAMRLEGSWEPLVTTRTLNNWGEACERWVPPPPGATLVVGIDHGTDLGKQAATLLAIVQGADAMAPRVWVLDECTTEGATTPEQDARAILSMLARNGFTYDNVDHWVGDRSTGWNKWEVKKSNKDVKIFLARELKRPHTSLKWIHTPTKYQGSERQGLRIMNAVMGRIDEETGRSHFLVSPAAKGFREACRVYRGDKRDPVKDVLDSGRYGVEHVVNVGAWFSARVLYA